MIAVLWKDLAAEKRSREMLSAMLVFALLVILIFNFALELDAAAQADVTSGVLWVTFAFAGTLGLNRSMAIEKDNGCLDGLLLCPVDRAVIFLGKLIGNLILIFVTGLVILGFFTVLYNLSLGSSWAGLVLVIALASIGFGAVGTLFAAVGAGVRARDALLAVFIFPLLVPLIIAAAHVSTVLFDGGGLGGAGLWPWFLVVYDVVFLSVSFMTFDFVVEE